MANEQKTHKKGTRRWAFPLGLLIAVLAIIGVVTILVAGVNATKKGIEKSKNYEEYNKMLIPVVMNDPDPFDDLTKANPSQLVDISIWSILKKGLSPDDYEYGDNGMLLPEAEVNAEFKRLFGSEIQPTHASIEGYGYDFAYDANKQVYVIPLTGIVPMYTPKVLEKEKKNNAVILTVGYLSGDQWQQDSNGNMLPPEPDKYMRVTLRENEGSYYISALQSTSAPETATPNPTEAPATEAPTTEVPSLPVTEVPAPVETEATAETTA